MESQLLDLVSLARYFRQQWKLVVLIFALCAVTGALYVLFATPLYRAQVTMQYVSSPQQGEIAGGALGIGLALAGLQGEKAIPDRVRAFGVLKSRVFQLGLIKQMNLGPAIFPKKYDSSLKKWRADVRPPSDEELFRSFSDRVLDVDDNASTGLVTVSIFLPSGELAEAVANSLVRDLNQELRDDSISQANKNIEYLNGQLAATQISEVRFAVAQLLQAEMRRLILSSNESTYSFRIIDPAVRPDRLYAPRPLLVIAFTLLAATLLSLFVVITRFGLSQLAKP